MLTTASSSSPPAPALTDPGRGQTAPFQPGQLSQPAQPAPPAAKRAAGASTGELVLGQGQTLGRAAARRAAATSAPPRPLAAATRPGPDPAGAAEDAPPAPSRPRSPRRAGRIGTLAVGQVLTWEAAILAVAAVHQQPLPLLIPVALLAGLALVVSAVRVRGRWGYEWLGLWLRFQTRRRARRISDDTESDPSSLVDGVLASVARGARISAMELDDGTAALISHEGGFTVLVEVVPAHQRQFIEVSHPLPPISVLLPPGEPGEPELAVQAVIHTVPAPGLRGAQDSAAVSYRQLTGGGLPARRRCWVAFQAMHTPDERRAVDLQAALINAVSRLQRRLRSFGLRGHVLAPEETVAELRSLIRLESSDPRQAGASTAVRERWSVWSTGEQVHTCFGILDWPDPTEDRAAGLLDRLMMTPSLATTVALAARHAGSEEIEVEATLRLTLPSQDAVGRATEKLRTTASAYGARVRRLDGEQVFGVAASLPLGGFLP